MNCMTIVVVLYSKALASESHNENKTNILLHRALFTSSNELHIASYLHRMRVQRDRKGTVISPGSSACVCVCVCVSVVRRSVIVVGRLL